MCLQKRKNVVAQEREVRCDDELNLLLRSLSPPLRFLCDVLDKLDIEQRLSALEFDLQISRGGAKHPIERGPCRFGCHVVLRSVHAHARHLAIMTRVIAAQSDDENVKPSKPLEERPFRTVFGGKQLDRDEGF